MGQIKQIDNGRIFHRILFFQHAIVEVIFFSDDNVFQLYNLCCQGLKNNTKRVYVTLYRNKDSIHFDHSKIGYICKDYSDQNNFIPGEEALNVEANMAVLIRNMTNGVHDNMRDSLRCVSKRFLEVCTNSGLNFAPCGKLINVERCFFFFEINLI